MRPMIAPRRNADDIAIGIDAASMADCRVGRYRWRSPAHLHRGLLIHRWIPSRGCLAILDSPDDCEHRSRCSNSAGSCNCAQDDLDDRNCSISVAASEYCWMAHLFASNRSPMASGNSSTDDDRWLRNGRIDTDHHLRREVIPSSS
jgi:hypothetical protein